MPATEKDLWGSDWSGLGRACRDTRCRMALFLAQGTVHHRWSCDRLVPFWQRSPGRVASSGKRSTRLSLRLGEGDLKRRHRESVAAGTPLAWHQARRAFPKAAAMAYRHRGGRAGGFRCECMFCPEGWRRRRRELQVMSSRANSTARVVVMKMGGRAL
jgi:hypothetical protein